MTKPSTGQLETTNVSDQANEYKPVRYKPETFRQMLGWCPAVIMIFLVALLIPSEISFKLGSIRLTPYKLVLLVTFFPNFAKLLMGKVARFNFVDFLIFFHLFWTFLVIEVHHGSGYSIESGGLRFIELGGAYLLARVNITDAKSFKGAFAFLILIICVLAPITFMESVTGQHFIKETASALSGTGFSNRINPRFGFHRAYGPFDHPILYGVFSASLFGVAWFMRPTTRKTPMMALVRQAAIVLAAVSSVSSGAVAALSTQVILIGWELYTRRTKNRWRILFGLFVALYMVVDVISNRSAIKVFLSYLSFSATTAYNRVIIFNYGIQDVWANPLFGIGFNVWTRPSWMHSTSMDNFWLVQAVTYGIPGFGTLALAVILLLSRKWKTVDPQIKRLRMGWTISMFGIVLTACTVHFWNNSFVYFGFLIGAGTWFQSRQALIQRKR
ncbi:MAG: O-antigen ligase family protein [Sneathiella sp.]